MYHLYHFCKKKLSWLSLSYFNFDINNYTLSAGKQDTKTAINVALLSLPQAIAYAAIAEVPLYYGIFCSIIASILAPFFASSKYTILGPTNASALIIASFFASHNHITAQQKIILLPAILLVAGVISVVFAHLKLGDLLRFVSRSVLVGYISGASLLIIINQIKYIIGIDYISTGSFFDTSYQLIKHVPTGHLQPFCISLIALVCYLLLRRYTPRLPSFALSLVFVAIALYVLKKIPWFSQHITYITSFSLDEITWQNPFYLGGDLYQLIPLSFAIAFICALENNIVSKSLASRAGDQINSNQDLLAVGWCNIVNAFIAPMPSSASLTRSAMNFDAPCASKLSSVFSAIVSLLVFLFIAHLLVFIPKAALSILIIALAFSLIKWKNIKIFLKSTKEDAAVLTITFFATLITRIDYAIIIGVISSLIFYIKNTSQPSLIEYALDQDGHLKEKSTLLQNSSTPGISIVHVEGNLSFGAAEIFQTQLKTGFIHPHIKVIILRLKNAYNLDATSVLALEELITAMRKQHKYILISGANKAIYKVLKRSGVLDCLQQGCCKEKGESNLFFNLPSNPNISTRDALLRAQQLLQIDDANITIVYQK